MCLCDAFLEAECAWIGLKKGDDVFEGLSFWIP